MAKAKGTTLLSMVKFLRSQRERATAVLAPSLHHYLDERIQPSSWYPEADLLALLRGMLELLPGDRELNLERMGAALAREHMEGVYGHLRSEDPVTLVRRSATLWGSQHDSGAIQVEIEGPGRARWTVRDYAIPNREMCSVLKGYFAECLRTCGWVGVQVQKRSCVHDGAASCTWTIQWIVSP